jgi:hypothetical protein
VSPFLEEEQKARTSITDKAVSPDLADIMSMDQLEEKFGGNAPNATQFWPPVLPDTPIGYDTKSIVSEEQYQENLKIYPHLLPRPHFITPVIEHEREERDFNEEVGDRQELRVIDSDRMGGRVSSRNESPHTFESINDGENIKELN